MSGTDYTKKAENGNTAVPKGRSGPLAIWWYELVFLYKGRAEKVLLALSFLFLAFSWVGIAYLASVFERPAEIIHCPGGQGL